MRIKVYGKNINVTDGLQQMLEKKLSKLDKYFNPEVEATATLSTQKNKHILEVQIQFNGNLLRAEEATDDMYASIDKVVDKLEGQLRKYKTKIERNKKDPSSIRFESFPKDSSDLVENRIVKTKRFPIKPMSPEEATLQMDLLGHSFFVFINSDSDDVNVVYKRKDGNYGLIEPTY